MSLTTGQKATIGQIVDAVAHHYGVFPAEITGPSRKHEFMRPRKMVMHLSRIHTEHSTEAISRELGGRDHSTVIAGSREAIKLLERCFEFRHDKELIVNVLFPNTPEAVCSGAMVARDQLNALCDNLALMFADLESGNATLHPHLSDVLRAARFVSKARGALMRTAFDGEGSNQARKYLNNTLRALDAALFKLDHPAHAQAENSTTPAKTQGEAACRK